MRKKKKIQSRLKIEGKNNAETRFIYIYIFSRQEQGKKLHNSMTVAKTY